MDAENESKREEKEDGMEFKKTHEYTESMYRGKGFFLLQICSSRLCCQDIEDDIHVL